MPSATASCSRLSGDLRLLAWGILLVLTTGLGSPGWANTAPNGTSVNTSSISVSPNTGTSTLDQLRAAKGDGVDLQFPSGFSCRVSGGDVPSLIVYGDQGSLGAANTTVAAGSRAGLAFILPLYRSRRHLCDRSMTLQNALSQLEIAEKLVSSGAMSNDEFMALSRQIKALTFGL